MNIMQKNNFILLILLIQLVNLVASWPFYYLFTKSNPINLVQVTPDNITNTNFDFNKKTVILIHGYQDNGISTTLNQIKNSILKIEDDNVLVVDWKDGAVQPYGTASSHAKITGEDFGEFIQGANINPKTVHCIGHGLGAHSCGFAGKIVKLNRISALDPSALNFEGNSSKRVDKTDADFVDVIHVDRTGIQDSIGHKDYFPNGGKLQPVLKGCELDPLDLLSCSYKKVPLYYVESVISPNDCIYISIRCDTYEQYQKELNKCDCGSDNGCPAMGFFDRADQGRGNFYLETKKSSPYCVR